MKETNKQRITYILAYTACLICPSLIVSAIFQHEASPWAGWIAYLPLFLAGVAGMFCNKTKRHLIFLLQMPTVFQAIFSTCYGELLHASYAYYVVLTTIVVCVCFILWQAYFRHVANTWQMLRSLCLGFLYAYAVLIIQSPGTHAHHLDLRAHPHTSTYIIYIVGLLITAVFCDIKNKRCKWSVASCTLCPYIFIGGFYIAPAIYHKLQYGTFTGAMQTKASLVAKHADGGKADKPLPGYQVCLITRTSNLWSLKKFEGLAAKYRGKPVHFLTLAIYKSPRAKKNIAQRYRTLHLQTPLYFIAQNELKSSPLRIKTPTMAKDYICIFKDNMLIYKGTADPTFQADRFLSKKLQP